MQTTACMDALSLDTSNKQAYFNSFYQAHIIQSIHTLAAKRTLKKRNSGKIWWLKETSLLYTTTTWQKG